MTLRTASLILLISGTAMATAPEESIGEDRLVACIQSISDEKRLACYKDLSRKAPSQPPSFLHVALESCMEKAVWAEQLACFDQIFLGTSQPSLPVRT